MPPRDLTWLIVGWELVMAVVAVVAWRRINRSQGRLTGRWMAAIVLLFAVGGLVIRLLVISEQRAGIHAGRTWLANNFRQIALSMNTYALDKGKFPAACSRGPDGKPLLSWRVAILPYMEEEELFAQFHQDEPWDSPHNLALLPKMPQIYTPIGRDLPEGLTRFQVYVGPGTPFEAKAGHAVTEIPDGTSRTVLVVEGEEAVPWTKPADLPFGPEVVLVRPHNREGFYIIVAADASVHQVPAETSEATLRALITRNGAENVTFP
jgi:hypothetical protein